MPESSTSSPRWVIAVCLLLAATQPLVVLFALYLPPEGAVPTGLHIPDSALFLHAMGMFDSGFASAYATCQSADGPASIAYYAVPHLWIYGILGAVSDLLRANDLLLYGFANGIGVFLYLVAVFRFLRQVSPRQDTLAFLLFTLSGGLGGLLYLIAALLGGTEASAFDALFLRFALYELVEGAHLLPVTHFPRLYYTLALALGFAALTQYHRALVLRCRAHATYAGLIMLAASFLYFRLAVFLLGVVLCYLWAHPFWPLGRRIRMFAAVAMPAALGGGAGALLLSLNPAVVQNHLDVANMAMWFSPFIAAAALHLVLAGITLRTAILHLAPWARACAYGAVGYLIVFAVLFLLYQAYYGNLLVARDAAVAASISDPALLGFVAGAYLASRRKTGFANPDNWIALWFLGALAVAISAFGQGWFLRFGPQRLELLLWLPLCILAARGLQLIPGRVAKAVLGLLVFLGTISVCVSVIFFQSPVGRSGARGPYPEWHPEIMHADDAAAMDALGEGMVLALPPVSDAIVARRGNPVVFGIGSFNLTDQNYTKLRNDAHTFFAPNTDDATRRALAEHWCADWIYCSATWPVPAETLHALHEASWLERVPTPDGAALFRVLR